MRRNDLSNRWAAFALALVAIAASACGGSSSGTGTSSTKTATPAQPSAAPASAGAKADSVLPKSCGERVPVSVVSTAIGKTMKLSKEVPAEQGLLCYYDVDGGSPSPIGFAARITYTALDHAPSRQEVNDYITMLNKNLGVAKIEEMSGLGDYAGWVTISVQGFDATAWAVIATKGRLVVDFDTFSTYTTGDRARLSEVVRKALG
jgi:hypothetical protein